MSEQRCNYFSGIKKGIGIRAYVANLKGNPGRST